MLFSEKYEREKSARSWPISSFCSDIVSAQSRWCSARGFSALPVRNVTRFKISSDAIRQSPFRSRRCKVIFD